MNQNRKNNDTYFLQRQDGFIQCGEKIQHKNSTEVQQTYIRNYL